MGWGDAPHEGYAARRLTPEAAANNDYPDQGDVRWTACWSVETSNTEGWQARCTCGWHSAVFHENHAGAEHLEERPEGELFDEWRDIHMAPIVDPDADHVLLLAEDDGGRRHFLAGRPVHAGDLLELRLMDDRWIPVRYEWSWLAADPPRGYMALGGRGEHIGWDPGVVSFKLPERAELRWPQRSRR